MKNATSNEVKRGQAISFRVPSDTPDHIVKHLQKLKETERRNFSSKIADFVMQGVSDSYSREKETITIPLPKKLTKAERDWLKHEHSEALLGSILYQLIADPVRSTSLLAALNSKSLDIDEALYLQEEIVKPKITSLEEVTRQKNIDLSPPPIDLEDLEDDLSSFDWEMVKDNQPHKVETENNEEENDVEALLGGFLANMNK